MSNHQNFDHLSAIGLHTRRRNGPRWHTAAVSTTPHTSPDSIDKPPTYGSQWRLVLRALPVAVIVLIGRFIFHNALDVSGLVTFSDAGAVITGATIIVGLMLAGVLSDYKESEKFPAVLGQSLLALDGLAVAGLSVKDIDGGWVRPRVSAIADAIVTWVHADINDKQMWAAQADATQLIVDIEKAGAPSHYVGRLLATNGDLTNALSRMQAIRNTSFIKAGYVLMVLLVTIVMILLVIVDFTSPIMRWVVPGVLALAYTYLILLVRDVDNPYQGSACVDFAPLLDAQRALASK
jgi:hypothetical protein